MAKSPIEQASERHDQLTLDRVLQKAPSLITDGDLEDLVVALRNQRARFIAADAKKAEKREGIEDGNEGNGGYADGDEEVAE